MGLRSTEEFRIDTLIVKPGSDSGWQEKIVLLDPLDRVTVVYTPTAVGFAIIADYFIDGITHEISPGDWTTAYSLMPAARFDAAIADAPALELGRFLLRPAGPAPFRFRIVYPDSAITPIGRYTVRATVRHGERCSTPPTPSTRCSQAALARRSCCGWCLCRRADGVRWATCLPPGADGTTRWQIDQDPDGTFQRRQTLLDRAALTSVDDIGRWRLEPPGQRLVLQGGREAPVFLQPLAVGATRRKLDLEG
jgi:hypothetical protein